MPAGKEVAKDRLLELVKKLREVDQSGKRPEFTEADVGSKFVLPFLELLGWGTKNIDEVREQKRTLTGPVDYSLNISKKPRLLVEIKRLTESLDGHRVVRGKVETFPEQAIRYAWHLKVDWVVLTNFEELRLYYSHVIKPQEGLVLKLRATEYSENFDRIWRLAKESVLAGVLDTYERRRTRRDIDEEVLEALFESRQTLTSSIRSRNPSLSTEDVRECVQKILDRILVIRVAEDRTIIGSDSLWKELDSWKSRGLPTPFMRSLKSLFRDFDDIYNSKLFSKHICEDLDLDNEALEKVIQALYKYNFDLISADVLGAIYEDYIGHFLQETKKGVDVIENGELRRGAGIYYTPIPIVEYIVRSTIGPELQDKSPEEIASFKIIDPACGSGSFLIKAFDVLKEPYDDYNRRISKSAAESNTLVHYGELIPNVEQKIVRENLHGVDMDPQATEIAAVNLMLKALRHGEKLPLILDENIRCGNSLVEDSTASEHPFKWPDKFPTIMNKGGFSAVIGNPPWGADLTTYSHYLESHFDLAKGQYDSYELFIELSKRLLREGGVCGLVIPDSIFLPEHTPLRKLLSEETQIEKIVKLGEGFFEGTFRACTVIVFRLKKPSDDHELRAMTLLKEDRVKVMQAKGSLDLFRLEEEKGTLIPQKRFTTEKDYTFNIFAGELDEKILELMRTNSIDWAETFDTGRGVEISKSGMVVQCPYCFKWDSPPRKTKTGEWKPKTCGLCGKTYTFEKALRSETIIAEKKASKKHKPIIVGEAVNRYYVSPIKYIDTGKQGINYKEPELYEPPKLVIRKTGIGIYATLDNSYAYTTQVVYIFRLKKGLKEPYRPEYFLALLNSRLMLYYYYKKFGELEWKSFPYLTQKTIQQLPLRKIDFHDTEQRKLYDSLVRKVSHALEVGKKIPDDLDFEIEDLVMKVYRIPEEDRTHIWDELKKVQRLRIIRETFGEGAEDEAEDPPVTGK